MKEKFQDVIGLEDLHICLNNGVRNTEGDFQHLCVKAKRQRHDKKRKITKDKQVNENLHNELNSYQQEHFQNLKETQVFPNCR